MGTLQDFTNRGASRTWHNLIIRTLSAVIPNLFGTWNRFAEGVLHRQGDVGMVSG